MNTFHFLDKANDAGAPHRIYIFFFLNWKGYIRYVLRTHRVHYLTNASRRDVLTGLVDDHLLNNTKVPMMHINGRRRREETDKKRKRES